MLLHNWLRESSQHVCSLHTCYTRAIYNVHVKYLMHWMSTHVHVYMYLLQYVYNVCVTLQHIALLEYNTDICHIQYMYMYIHVLHTVDV